jgi:predicted transcriptional regulator
VKQTPKSGLTPEWEKDENKKKIYLTLLKKRLTFSELMKETNLSTATLSSHLKNLQTKKIIQRTIWKGKRVYEIIPDEEKIASEFKAFSLEILLEIFEEMEPIVAKTWKAFTECLIKEATYFKKREMLGEPRLSAKELFIKTYEIIDSTTPSEVKKSLGVGEVLEKLRKTPEDAPEFQDFERIRKSVEKRIRLKKVKSNERS